MIPELLPILTSLFESGNDLTAASKAGDANKFYQSLTNLERLAAYHKNKMMSRMVIDPTITDDDEL